MPKGTSTVTYTGGRMVAVSQNKKPPAPKIVNKGKPGLTVYDMYAQIPNPIGAPYDKSKRK
jgi:hypothetical protein